MVEGDTIREIFERLGIETDLEKERVKVNTRLKVIFNHIYYYRLKNTYPACYRLQMVVGQTPIINLQDSLRDISREHNLEYNLFVAEKLLDILKEMYGIEEYNFLKLQLVEAIDLSTVDLGIIFENDRFIKSGAKELDKVAILEPLEWLNSYPGAKKLFENALQYYLTKNYPDAITNAYSALESLVKTVLSSNRTLDNLISALMSLLSLPPPWSAILKNYCDFAHEFSTRHGRQEGRKSVVVAPKDVEAFIYFTGLMIRLIIRTVEESE
jgi:hypothetical protein